MKRVLIVDDDLIIQDIISSWLIESYAVKILLASNVSEALSYLENNSIDFIICDYEMPDGNGMEILNYLKINIPEVPIILFSGRYDLAIPIVFPLMEVITDKSFEKLFRAIQKHQSVG